MRSLAEQAEVSARPEPALAEKAEASVPAAAAKTEATGEPLLPILECVQELGSGRYRAYFGYQNDSLSTVTVPVGSRNKFTPEPSGRGQPTVFEPGRTAPFPAAAFSVNFSASDDEDDADDDGELTWTLKGPDNRTRKVTASPSSPRCALAVCETTFFGPKRYTRTTGPPNEFDDTVTVPDAAVPPFLLKVVNGGAGGADRVSSARIEVNNVEVAGPSDFNQQVAGFERLVTLSRPTSTLEVTLQSAPGSFLTIEICGEGQAPSDQTPPLLTVAAPGEWIAESTPQVVLDYEDPAGPALPSGVAPSTLVVAIDGVDRTSLFTKGPTEATGIITPDLADGPHTLSASIKDVAGNQGSATLEFTVDTGPPVVAITSPAEGAYTKASPQEVTGTVTDLDPQLTVDCRRGGEIVPATVSSGFFTCALPLVEGANALDVVARDRLSHEGRAAREVVLDTIAPSVTLLQPMNGDAFTGGPISAKGGVIDASPVTVRVNGIEATVAGAEFTATGVPLGAGPMTSVQAVARDRAGNEGEATVTVRIDGVAPVVTIDSPLPDAYLKGPQVAVTGSVVDDGEVMVDVNDQLATVTGGSFSAEVTAPDGRLTLTATARDAAGNTGTASLAVNVDTVPPAISVSTPGPGLVTKAATLLIEGTVLDASPLVLRFEGNPIDLSGSAFSVEVPLPPGDGTKTFVLEAEDKAHNFSQAGVSVVVDRTPPELTIETPVENATLGALPLVVQGTVRDQTTTTVTVNGAVAVRTGDAWQAPFDGLSEGIHSFQALAVDAAGNESTVARTVRLDLLPPLVTIDSPATGTLTREGSVEVVGTASDATLAGVAVNGIPAVLGPDGSFTATVALAPGDNSITAVATDALGRTAQAQVTLTRDSEPPVVEIQSPEGLAKGRTATVVVTATDNLALAETRLKVNGVLVGTPSTSGSVVFELAVPDGMIPGDTIAVRGEATDTAGNESFFQRGVKVLGSGAVVGQVLDDDTGLPLAGATVGMLPGTETATTDERGRYSLPTLDSQALLVIEDEERTTVERSLAVASGVGSVPLDARLTRLGPRVTLDGLGGALAPPEGARLHGLLVLDVPPASLAAATEFRLTPLSPQGLPGLLPLGWSPLAAFDLRADGPWTLPIEAEIAGLPDASLYVARYDTTTHAFVAVEGPIAPVSSALAVSVPAPGSYVLAAADEGEPLVPVPAPGEPLQGVSMVELPVTVTSESVVTPKTLPPTGGTATGGLTVRSPLPLPSGTVVQAEVVETYSLSSGEEASSEPRSQDILLYRTECASSTEDAGVLCAAFPITPSRSYRTEELTEGRVHLDILAGRESVRGKTGGSDPVTLTSEGVALSVPGMALPKDTALSVEAQTGFSSFLPEVAGLEALQELVLDFSGESLALSAGLSVEGTLAAPGDTVVLARVERVSGIPRLAVVSLASVDATGKVTTIPHPDLPGVTREGRYVFYRLLVPIGIIKGTATAGGRSLVAETAGLPFIGVASGSGADTEFVLVSGTGTVTVHGSVPGTSLSGQATANVDPGATASVHLALSGTVTTAAVAPSNGTENLPTNTTLTITSPTALAPGSVSTETLKLRKVSDDSVVPVKVLLSGSGKTVSVLPLTPPPADEQEPPKPPLEFSTEYRLLAAELTDIFGGLVQVRQTSFTTKDDVAPVYDYGQLSFRLKDGVVTLVAPDLTFPPGTQVLIINTATGEVASFTVGNSGGFSAADPFPATFLGSADHSLIVTITDPLGNTTTFTKGQFVTEDGKTLVGPGGGVVTGEGGVELRIPEGALDKGVELELSLVPESEISALFPNGQLDQLLPGTHFGSMLRLNLDREDVTFKKEVDVAFPLPDFTKVPPGERPADPGDAFYYVNRRIEMCPDGQGPEACAEADRIVVFEAIDEAHIEGEGASAKVVTSSPPFAGLLGALAATAVLLAVSWSFEIGLKKRPKGGLITGKVLRQKWNPGAEIPEYVPVKGARVSGEDAAGVPLQLKDGGSYATSQEDGTYALWDTSYAGGTVKLVATDGGQTATATAFEAPGPERYPRYEFEARANLTFPPIEPPPVPPQVGVVVLRASDGKEIGGVAVAGAPLLIGFRNNTPDTLFQINSAQVQGQELVVAGPLSNDPNRFFYKLSEPYTPSSPGAYTVTTTAIPGLGSPVDVSSTFRVIAAGGGIDNDPSSGPKVITDRTLPKRNETGVPITIFPEVAFTEPVRKIPGNVKLLDAKGSEVAIHLSGVGTSGQVIEDVASESTVVTSLTVQPVTGLRYSTTYRLILTAGIEDLDKDALGNPAPKSLEAYETSFTTFGPAAVGASDEKGGSTGIVVLGDRAYLTETYGFVNGNLIAYAIDDPVKPVVVGYGPGFAPRPYAITGEEGDGGERLVAVAAGSTNRVKPSSVLLFDAAKDDDIRWVGVASLTSSGGEGYVARLAMKGGQVFAATVRKGVQVVDVGEARAALKDGEDPVTAFDARVAINTDGRGFGQEAVVQTIPFPQRATGGHYVLEDIDVADIQGQRVAMVLGEPGLVLVNTSVGNIAYPSSFPGRISTDDGVVTLVSGAEGTLGRLQDRDVAVIAGTASIGVAGNRTVLMVVDVSTPTAPRVMGYLDLTGEIAGVSDVLLREGLALVASQDSVLLVSLASLSEPRVVGKLEGTVGGRLAMTDEGILFSSAYLPLGGTSPLGAVRSATLDVLPAVTAPPLWPLSRQGKTLRAEVLDLKVYPESTEVETAEMELFKEGTSEPTRIPLSAFNGAATYTFPRGSAFNPDLLYEARLVINRGLVKEKTGPKQRLRPALLDLVGETSMTEVDLDGSTGNQDEVDVVRMFNGAPTVSLVFKSFVGSGGGETATVNVEGTVSSAIAPIERVVVNEKLVVVSQTGTGDGFGPFTGTFGTSVEVGPQTELITAYAVDSVKHVSTASLQVRPRAREPREIPGRDILPLENLVPGDTDASSYAFKVVLKDRGSRQSTAQVSVAAVGEVKTLKLNREGAVFTSVPLLALPDSFELSLQLPPELKERLQTARIAVRLGERPTISIGAVETKPVVSGVNVVGPGGGKPVALLDPASGLAYTIEVGLPGTIGPTVEVTTSSMNGRMGTIGPGDLPAGLTLTLGRASRDPESPSFNLYLAKPEDGVVPLMGGVNAKVAGKSQRVVPFGRFRVETPSGLGLLASSLTLPVGAGADRVTWRTVRYRGMFDPSVLINPYIITTLSYYPLHYEYIQSATFQRGDTPLPGLLVTGFLDKRTTLINDETDIVAIENDGQEYPETTFPQTTGPDGTVYFKVTAKAIGQDPNKPVLAGVVLAFTDFVGIRALAILGGASGLTLPIAEDESSEHGKNAKTTPIVAGYATVGGLPRRHSVFYQRVAALLLDQMMKGDPSLLDLKKAIEEAIQKGFTAKGVVLAADVLEEYVRWFLIGALAGLPRGAIGAFVDSVIGAVDLVKAGYNLLVPESGADAIKKVLTLSLVFNPITGPTAVGVISAPYIQEAIKKLQSPETRAYLVMAAEFLSRDEVQAFLTTTVISKVLTSYQKELGPFTAFLGMEEGTVGYRPLVFGYSVGAVTGYVVELLGEAVAVSFVGEGIGATLPFLVKAGRLAKGSEVVASVMRLFNKARAGNVGSKLIKGTMLLIKVLDALGPNALDRWLLRISQLEQGPERMFVLLLRYGDLAEGPARLVKMGNGLKDVDNVADTLAKLGDMADDSESGYRFGKAMIVSAENAEDVARAAGRMLDIASREPELARGFELLFRNVEELEKFLKLFADSEDDALRGVARMVPCLN